MGNFPTSIELADGISMSTGFTGPITVTSDYLDLNLDGSVFLTSKGYERTATANAIPLTDGNSTSDLILFIGDYVLETAANAFNAQPFNYSTSLVGIPVSVALSQGLSMKFVNGDFELTASPKIKAAGSVELDATATVDVNPVIGNGGSSYICKVNPGLDDIKLSKADIKIFGFDLPIT